jgi:uncharacterized protein
MKNETTPPSDSIVNKKKLYLGIFFLLCAIVAVIFVFVLPDKPAKVAEQPVVKKDSLAFVKEGTATFYSKNKTAKCTFDVEIADTPERQKQGLMFRESMYDKQGMLFPNDTAKIQTFWMKNTYLPLDIIFIGADSTIVSISEYTTPFSEQTLSSEGPAQFVLEINAGQSRVFDLIKGDKFSWTRN